MPIEGSEPNQSELIIRLRRLLQELRIQNNNETERKSELVKQKAEKSLNTLSSTYEENAVGIRNNFEEKIREIKISVEKENRGFESAQKHKIKEIQGTLRNFSASIKPGGWDWNSLKLEDLEKTAEPRSKFIRIGSLSVDDNRIFTDLPALIDTSQKNIVIHTKQDASQSCVSLVKNIILRLLISLPPQMIKLHLIDPLGLGSNFEFLEPGRSSFSENVISDIKSIEKLLSETRQAITDTRSKLLGKYTNIEDYNEKVGGHHLDYHFIILLDFPKWYSQQVATDLIPILQSGSEAGVFMVFHTNESEEVPEYWKWNDRSFSKKVININVKGGKASWDLDQFSGYEIKLENLPEETFISQIIQTANAGKDSLLLPTLPYEKIAIPEVDWGKGDSTPSISVPIGIGEDSEIFEITLGLENNSIHHGIIGGMIGSGKGNFLRVLITQLLSKYSPEELELYLLDFKQAQDLGNYQTHPVKHIRATIGNDDLFSGVVILRWLKGEKSRRSIEMGTAVKLEELRRTGKRLSRILVIIDEFPKLLSDKTYGTESQELLKELAKEGRAYGIHIFLSTQTLENLADMRTAYGQMGLRVALKVEDPSHSEKILGPGNTKASELEEIGLAIINQTTTRGKADKSTKVKIAFLENGKQRDILKKINQQYGKAETRILGHEKPKKIIDDLELFYGNNSPDKNDGEILIGVGVSSELKIGDSGTIVDNTYIPLNEEHGSNILLVGSDLEQAKQILQSAIISFTYQTHSSSKIKLLTFPKISSSIQGLSAYVDNRLELIDPDIMVNELIQADNLIQERLSSNDDPYDPMLFLFFGIGRISKIKEPLGNNLRDVTRGIATAGNLISSIIKDGSKVRIYSIIWVEKYDEMNIFGRQPEDLKLRIALHGLTIDAIRKTLELDATHKITIPTPDQAYYRNLGVSEEVERFTPYLQLNQDELQAPRPPSK